MFLARVFLPFAAGYFLSQLLRSVNAVVGIELSAELALSSFTLGLLTSAYFFAFAGAQIPVGLALDRFGPWRTEAFLLLFAAGGSLLFGSASTATGLIAGRALIGFGVSACLMASFHAFVLEAPADRLPFLNGAVMAVGAAGALAATTPVEWAIATFDWRAVFHGLAVLTLAAAFLVGATSRFVGSEAERETLAVALGGLGRIFRSRLFWSVAPLSVAHQGAYLAIQSLWAGPWLRDVAGLDRAAVASHLFTLAAGMGLGFLGLGTVASWLSRRGFSPARVWIPSAILFQGAQAVIALGGGGAPRLVWFLFGLFGAAGMLSYVIVSAGFPKAMAGRVNTGLNVLVFTGAFAVQAGVGALLSWASAAGAEPPRAYGLAFGLVLGLQVLALVWLVATRRWRG